MKINELKLNVKNTYLYEGLTPKHKTSMMLWESAGRAIMEADLTVDQINQLFQQIEKGQTDLGGNRTLLGKGKDAAVTAAGAWNDLKNKIYDSAPMQNFASAYDQAAEKLKQATGGDQGAMQYVEKYRAFAKKHPIIQGFLYSALIAAAGISSAGLGGAAALALLKTADKALQGEDIRSAIYSGAKTGALAYGASKLGDLIRGDKGAPGAQQAGDVAGSDPYGITAQAKELTKDYDPTKYNYVGNGTEINIIDKATGQLAGTYPVDMATADEVIAQAGKVGKLASGAVDTATNVAGNLSSDSVSKGAYKIFADKVANGEVTNLNSYNSALNDALTQAGSDQLTGSAKKFAYNGLKRSIRKAAARAAGGNFSGSNTDWLAQTIKTFGGDVNAASADLAKDVAATAAQGQFESRTYTPEQVTALFEHIIIAEGLFDKFKTGAAKVADVVGQGVKNVVGKAAGAVAQKAQQVGHNLTTKVTADKLSKAWKAAGSPTDSAAIAKVLQSAGVNPQVIQGAFKAVGADITATASSAEDPAVFTPGGNRDAQQTTPAVDVTTLTPQQKQELLKQLDALDAAEAAQQPAQQQPKMAIADPRFNPAMPKAGQSSTGGTVTPTSTGYVHRANPNNPNLKAQTA